MDVSRMQFRKLKATPEALREDGRRCLLGEWYEEERCLFTATEEQYSAFVAWSERGDHIVVSNGQVADMGWDNVQLGHSIVICDELGKWGKRPGVRKADEVFKLLGDTVGDLYDDNLRLKKENRGLKAVLKEGDAALTDVLVHYKIQWPATMALQAIHTKLLAAIRKEPGDDS